MRRFLFVLLIAAIICNTIALGETAEDDVVSELPSDEATFELPPEEITFELGVDGAADEEALYSGQDADDYSEPVEPEAVEAKVSMEGSEEDNAYHPNYEIYGTTLYKYTGRETEIVIPEEWGITTIASQAFKENELLKSIVLPEGLTEIQFEAFMGCKKLERVVIPETVTTIGEKAFLECRMLKDANIPQRLERLENWAFTRTAICTADLPDSLVVLGNGAFNQNPNLTEVRLPSNLTEIPSGLFAECGLQAIDIPAGVKRIGDEAFYANPLKEITLPDGLIELGKSALSKTDIIELRLPETLKSLGRIMLVGIQYLVIPESVTEIDTYQTFMGDTEMETIVFPASFSGDIGEQMFDGCTKLKRISIPEGTQVIGKNAFSGCYGLRQVTLPSTLTTLKLAAFGNCSSLESITIPSSVVSIEGDVFYNHAPGFTIYCEAGSAAEQYAKDQGIRYSTGAEPEVPDLPEVLLSKNAKLTGYVGDVFLLRVNAEISDFRTSNDSVAHVTSAGIVTLAQEGKAKITALLSNGKKRTLSLTVKDATKPDKLVIEPSGSVTIDKSAPLQISYTLYPVKAESQVTWKSSNPKIATVSDAGLVTPLKEGKVTIQATTVKGGKTAKVKLKIVDLHAPTGVSIEAPATNVIVGEALQLTAVATAKLEPAITTYTWKTSDKAVATVSEDGLVVPLKVGKAKITVTTENKKKATVTIKVVNPYAPTGIKLDKKSTIKLKVGETVQLNAELSPVTAIDTVKWTTSKASVATVEDGLVTAVKKGSATITVTTSNGKKAKVKVKVS